MSSYKEQFPSKFLKAEDLGDSHLTGTIVSCAVERVGQGSNQEDRLVLGFRESILKPLVMNKTNCESVEKIAGSEDTEDWIGHRIVLYATETTFGGKTVPCVRIKAPKAASKISAAASAAAPTSPEAGDLAEGMPF
jgi:hypothetical protein